MMNQEQFSIENQEIDIIDIMKTILKHWKSVACAMLIGAVLGCIWGIQKSPDLIEPTDAQMTEYQKAYDAYRTSLTSYLQQKEQEVAFQGNKDRCQASVDYYQKLVNYVNDELQNNPLLDDSVNLYKASVNLYIKCDLASWSNVTENVNWDPADIVIRNYINYMNTEFDWKEVADKLNVSPDYITSLVKYSEDMVGNDIIVVAYGVDEKSANILLDIIVQNIMSQYESVSEIVGNHEILELNQLVVGVDKRDSYIENYRNGKDESLINYKKALNQAIQEQIQFSDTNLVEPQEPVKPEAYYADKSVSDIIKYIIIGLLLGGFVICGVHVAIYLFDGRIHTESELENYGLQVLGNSNDMQRVVLNICNFVQPEESVMLTGTMDIALLERIGKVIQEKLPDYQFVISKNMFSDNETIAQIKQVDRIILIEKLNKSKRLNVIKQLKYYQLVDKKVVGVVLG